MGHWLICKILRCHTSSASTIDLFEFALTVSLGPFAFLLHLEEFLPLFRINETPSKLNA